MSASLEASATSPPPGPSYQKSPSPRSPRSPKSPRSPSSDAPGSPANLEQVVEQANEQEHITADQVPFFRFIDGFVDEQHARVPPAPLPYVPELQVDGPNDDRQNDGLDIAHHFITLLLGDKLYEAPIDEPKRVLDVGTGTGIWAIDVADAHPAAEVTGFDISPIQPFWVPPNCKFHIDDAQLEWTYPPASFDLIHIRALYGSIADWPKLYGEAFKALKPGGYLENFEFTISLCSDAPSVRDDPKHVFKQWGQVFTEAMDRLGKTAKIGLDGRRSATWSRLASRILLSRITGSPVAAGAEIMGWEYIEILLLVANMRKAIRDVKLRPYYIVPNFKVANPWRPSSRLPLCGIH
ncbi:UMTA [Verticillium alfalfae VaMs.102]|uniref:UMTA n=1 Tax=Verticillium alfalfae (strain VaMs.102 / ATCC MYA-4576 / FGSC 10136) TaxID=526221 RepID=C9SYZ7_VERA1|nr:UMTA [Verticillium alfalfae VaMs.102]EEY24012.1 UMTA [Verticillium alfalfae VaMs.102]